MTTDKSSKLSNDFSWPKSNMRNSVSGNCSTVNFSVNAIISIKYKDLLEYYYKDLKLIKIY